METIQKDPIQMTIPFEMLGKTYVDLASDLVGIVVGITQRSNGCVQATLQPKGDGKTMPDGWSFDVEQLAPVLGGPAIRPKWETFPTEKKYSAGDIVEDTYTKYPGTVADVIYHLNGCITVKVTGEYDKKADGGGALSITVDQGRLRPIRVAPPITEPPKPRVGGPAERMIRD